MTFMLSMKKGLEADVQGNTLPGYWIIKREGESGENFVKKKKGKFLLKTYTLAFESLYGG